MNTIDFVVIGVVVALIALAVYKIVRDKKRGARCCGCSACCEQSEKSGCFDKASQ
ncbi:MAG: FeoB-associated Cys-rich membrane protein [Peptococcaceae bacterium]|nr:FeoB-associated Cys-rich membrane protein [Peptococcaceae bacterium]